MALDNELAPADFDRFSANEGLRQTMDPLGDTSTEREWGRDTGTFNLYGKALTKEQIAASKFGSQYLDLVEKEKKGDMGFWEAATPGFMGGTQSVAQYLPFVNNLDTLQTTFANMDAIPNTVRRIQAGEQVSDDERVQFAAYMLAQERLERASWVAKAGNIVPMSVGFGLEFLAATALAKKTKGASLVALAGKAGTEIAEAASAKAAKEVITKSVRATIGQQYSRFVKKALSRSVYKTAAEASEAMADDLVPKVLSAGSSASMSGVTDIMHSGIASAFTAGSKKALMAGLEGEAVEAAGKAAAKRFAAGALEDQVAWAMKAPGVGSRMARGARLHLMNALTFNREAGEMVDPLLRDRVTKALGFWAMEMPVYGAYQKGLDLVADAGLRAGATALGAETSGFDVGSMQNKVTGYFNNDQEMVDHAVALSIASSYIDYSTEFFGVGFDEITPALFSAIAKPTGKAIGRFATKMAKGEQHYIMGKYFKAAFEMASGTLGEARNRISSIDEGFKAATGTSFGVKDIFNAEKTGALAGQMSHGIETRGSLVAGLGYLIAKKAVEKGITPESAMRVLKTMGYDGVVGEMAEERASSFFSGLTGVNDGSAATEGWGGLSFAKGLQAVKDDLSGDQLYSEALAFSLPMVGVSILSHAQSQLGGGVLAKARALGQNAAQMQDAMNSAVVTIGPDGKAVIHGNVDKTSPNAADALTTDATPGQIIQTNLNSMGDTVLGFFTENLDFSRGHTQGSMAAKIADSALSFVKFLITANPAMMQRNPIMAEIAGMDETTAWVLGDVSKGVLKNKENAEAAFLARQTAKVTATGETAVVGDMATDAEYLADIKRINEEGRDAFKRGLLKVIANKGAVIFDREEQLDTARRIFPGQTANGYNAEKTGDEWSYTLPNVEGKLTDDQLLSKFSSVLDLATSEKMFRSENAMGYSAVATTFLDAARYQVPNENSVLTPVWLDTMASAASRAGTSMRVDFTKGFRADLRSLSNDPNGKDLSANASEYAILSDAQKVGTPAYRQALETLVQRDYGIAPSALSSPGAMQWAEDNIIRQAKILNTIITDRKTVSTLDANGKRITVGELQLDSATGTYSSYTLDKDTGAQVTVATGVAKDAALKALADEVGTGPTDNMVVSGSRIIASPIESLVFYAGQISGTVFAHYVGHYAGVFNANDPAHQDMSWEQKADAMAAEQAEYLASKKLAGIEQHEPKAYPDAKSQEVLVSAGLTKEQAEKFAAYSNFLVDVLQVARGEKFTVSFSNDGVPVIRGLASNTNNSKGEITLSPYSLMPGQIAGTHTGLAEDTIEVWMRRFPGVWTNPQARYVLEAHLTSVAQVLRGLAEDLSTGQAAGAPSGAADKLTTLADKCDPQSPTFARNEVLSHVFNSSMLGHEYGDNLFSGLSAKFTIGEETINVADILRKQSSFAGFSDVFVNLVSRATEANNVNYGSVAGTGTRIAAVLADRQSRTRQTLDLMAVDSTFIDQKLTDSVKLSVASATANPIPAYVPRAARIEPAADTPETPTGGAQASAFNPAGGRERMVWDLTGYLYRAVSTGSTAGVVGKVADAWNRVKSQYDYNTDEGQRAFGAIAYDEFRNSRSGVGYSDAERDSYLATLEHRRKQSSTDGGDVHLDLEDPGSTERGLDSFNDNNGDKHALTLQTFMFITSSLGIDSEGSSSYFHEDPVQMIQYVLNGLMDYTWEQKGKEPHQYIPTIEAMFTPRQADKAPKDFFSDPKLLQELITALRYTARDFNATPGFTERAKVLDALADYLLSVPRKDANIFINTTTSVTSFNGVTITVNAVGEGEKAGSNGISIQSASDPLGGDGLDTVANHAGKYDPKKKLGLLGQVEKAKHGLFDVLSSVENAIYGLTGVGMGAGAKDETRALWDNPNNPLFGEYAPVTDAGGKIIAYVENKRGQAARAAVAQLEALEGPVALGALSYQDMSTEAFTAKCNATAAAMEFSADVIALAVGPNPTSTLLRDPASVRRIAEVWSTDKIVKVFVQSYERSYTQSTGPKGAVKTLKTKDLRTNKDVTYKVSHPGDLIKDVVNVYEAVRIAIANAPQSDILTEEQKTLLAANAVMDRVVLAKNILLARETTANKRDATPASSVTNPSVANLRTVDTTIQHVFSIIRRGVTPSRFRSFSDSVAEEKALSINALGVLPSAVIETVQANPQMRSLVEELAGFTSVGDKDKAIQVANFLRFGRYPGSHVSILNTFAGMESVSAKGHTVSQYKSANFADVAARLERVSDPTNKNFDGFVYFPVYTGDKSSRYIVAIPAMYYDKFAPEAKTYAQRHEALGACLAGTVDEKRVAVLNTNTGTAVLHPQGASVVLMFRKDATGRWVLREPDHGTILAGPALGHLLGNNKDGSTQDPVTEVKAHMSWYTHLNIPGFGTGEPSLLKGFVQIYTPAEGQEADYISEVGTMLTGIERDGRVAYATEGDAAKASPLLSYFVVDAEGNQTRLAEYAANGGDLTSALDLVRAKAPGVKGVVKLRVNDGGIALTDLVPGLRVTNSFTLGGDVAVGVATDVEGNAFDMRKAADLNKSSKIVSQDITKNGGTDDAVAAATNMAKAIPEGDYDHSAVSGADTLKGITQLSAEIAEAIRKFTTTIRGSDAHVLMAVEALIERDPDTAALLRDGGLSMQDPLIDKALFEYIVASTKSFVPNTSGIRAALVSSGAKAAMGKSPAKTGLGEDPVWDREVFKLTSDGTQLELDGVEDRKYVRPAHVLSAEESILAGGKPGGARVVSAGSCRLNAVGRGIWYNQIITLPEGVKNDGVFASTRHNVARRILSLLSRQAQGAGFRKNPLEKADLVIANNNFAAEYSTLLRMFTTQYNGLAEMTAGASFSNTLTGYGIAHIAEFDAEYTKTPAAERPALLAKYFDYTYFTVDAGQLIFKGTKSHHMRTPSGSPRAHQFHFISSPVDYQVADGTETRKVYRGINAKTFAAVLKGLIPDTAKGDSAFAVFTAMGNITSGTDIAHIQQALKVCGARMMEYSVGADGLTVYAFVDTPIEKGTLLPGPEAKVMRDSTSRGIAGDDNDGDETVITFCSSIGEGLLHRLTADRTMPEGAVTLDPSGMGIKVSDTALKFLGEAMWWQEFEAFRSQPLGRLAGYEVKDPAAGYDLVMTGYATMPTAPTTLFPGVKGAEAATPRAGDPRGIARSVDEANDAGKGRAIAVISTSKYQASFVQGVDQMPAASKQGARVIKLPLLVNPATGKAYQYDVWVDGVKHPAVSPMADTGFTGKEQADLLRANHEFASFYAANFCNTLFDSMKGKYPAKMRLLHDNLSLFYDLLFNIKWVDAGILNPKRDSNEYQTAYGDGMAKLIAFQQAFIDWYTSVEPGWEKAKAYYASQGAVPTFSRYLAAASNPAKQGDLEPKGLWPKEEFGVGVGLGASQLMQSYSPLAQEYLDGIRTPLVFGTNPEKLFNQNRDAVDARLTPQTQSEASAPMVPIIPSNRNGTKELGQDLVRASRTAKESLQAMTVGYSFMAVSRGKTGLQEAAAEVTRKAKSPEASAADKLLAAAILKPEKKFSNEERVNVAISAAEATGVWNDMDPRCRAFLTAHASKMPLSRLIGSVLFTATMADHAYSTMMRRMPNTLLAFLTEKANGQITFRGAPGLTLLDYASKLREDFVKLYEGSGFAALAGEKPSSLGEPGTLGYFLQFPGGPSATKAQRGQFMSDTREGSRAWKAMMAPGIFGAANQQIALDALALTSKDVASLLMLYTATTAGATSPRFSTRNFGWVFPAGVHEILSQARAYAVSGPANTDAHVRIAYGNKATVLDSTGRLLINDWFRSLASSDSVGMGKAFAAHTESASKNIRFATKGTVAGYLAGIGVTEGQGEPVADADGAYLASDLAIEILDADAKTEVNRLSEEERKLIAQIAGLQFASPTFATAMDTISFLSYTLGGMSKELNSAILGALNTQRMKPWAQDILDRGHEAQMAEANASLETQVGSEVYDAIRDAEMGDISTASAYSGIGKRRLEEYTSQLTKAQELYEGINVEDTLAYLQTLLNSKKEKMTMKWALNGTARFPEDGYKVEEAYQLAEKAKVDPLGYASASDLIDALGPKVTLKGKPTDPDTVPEFSDKKVLSDGYTTYAVADTKEGQSAVRKVIDTHWGEDANPWCLAARDPETGDLREQAWNLWHKTYDAPGKRIAFKDGKLVAFKAWDTTTASRYLPEDVPGRWWDRQDRPSEGVQVSSKEPGPLGRDIVSVFNLDDGVAGGKPIKITRGVRNLGNADRKAGTYEAWDPISGELKVRDIYDDEGLLHGPYISRDIQHSSPAKQKVFGSAALAITTRTGTYVHGSREGVHVVESTEGTTLADQVPVRRSETMFVDGREMWDRETSFTEGEITRTIRKGSSRQRSTGDGGQSIVNDQRGTDVAQFEEGRLSFETRFRDASTSWYPGDEAPVSARGFNQIPYFVKKLVRERTTRYSTSGVVISGTTRLSYVGADGDGRMTQQAEWGKDKATGNTKLTVFYITPGREVGDTAGVNRATEVLLDAEGRRISRTSYSFLGQDTSTLVPHGWSTKYTPNGPVRTLYVNGSVAEEMPPAVLTDSQAVYNFNERIGAGDAQASAFALTLSHVTRMRKELQGILSDLSSDSASAAQDNGRGWMKDESRAKLELEAGELARRIVAGEHAVKNEYTNAKEFGEDMAPVNAFYKDPDYKFMTRGDGFRNGGKSPDPLFKQFVAEMQFQHSIGDELSMGEDPLPTAVAKERQGPIGVAKAIQKTYGAQASAFSPMIPDQTYETLLGYVSKNAVQMAAPSNQKDGNNAVDLELFLSTRFDGKKNPPAQSQVVQKKTPIYGAIGPQLLVKLYRMMNQSGDANVTLSKLSLVTARLIRDHLAAIRNTPGGANSEAGFLQDAANQLQAYGESGVKGDIVIRNEQGGVYREYATLHAKNTLTMPATDPNYTAFTMNAHLMSAFYALSAQVMLRDQSTTEWKPVDEAVQAVADYGSYLEKPVIPAAALVADSPESLMPWGLAAEAPEASEDTPAFMTRTRVLPYDVWMAGMMPSAFYGMNLRDLMTDHTAESTLTIMRNELHMISEYLGGAEHGVISLLDYGTDREIAYEKTGVRVTDNTGKKTERFARTGLGLRSQSLTDEQRDTVGWLKDTVWSYMLSPSDGGHQITGIDVRFGDILNRDTLEKLGSFNFGTADEADSDGKRHITYALNKALSEAAASLPKEIYTAWVGRAKAALDTAVATNKAIMASRETAKKYNKLSINELFNRVVLAEFRKQGLVAVYTGLEGNVNDTIFAAEYVKAKLSVPTAMSEEAIRTSSWYELLTTKYGRDAAKLTVASLSERLSKVYSDAQAKVDANTPWILTADGKKLRGPDGLAPFRVGRGVYRRGNVTIDKVIPDFDATVNRVLEQLKGSLSVDAEGVVTAKGATNRTYALVADLYGIEENSIRAYGQKGRAGVPIADIAGLGVLIQDMHENARAAGRAVPAANTFSDMDLIHAVATRMIHNYYNTATSNQKLDLADIESTLHEIGFNALMKHAGPANISRNEGMREMYEKFNLLPKGGLGATGALNEWANETETALRWRQAAVVMMMSSDSNGDPILVAEPNLKTPVSEDIIPDGVWAALARFWGSKASPEFKYDGNLTGRENAAAAAALYQQLAKVGKNRYARGEVDKYRLVEASGLGSVNRMYARRDVNSDQSCLMNNFTGGEAAGYAEGLMYALGLDNYKSKSVMITKIVKWSRMLNMSMSTFFAWATGVESDIMASGLESFLANFSPAKARKFSKTRAYKFMHAIPVIGGIMGDSITGNRTSTRDMTDKVKSVDPLMYEARAMAKAMGLISSNMMYDTGSLDGDLKVLTDTIHKKFGPGAVKSLEGMRRMVYNAIPEASFEYILEGAKMATITNYMTALKNKAESQGRRFNAKREMARWMPYINSELGGLDLAVYPWLTPGGNELTKQLFMSFQWSMGALEAGGAGILLKKLTGHAFKPEVQSFMAMRWARTAAVILFGLPAMLQVLNKAVGLAGGVDDPTDKWLMWNNELNKRTHANLTPLLRAIAKIPGVKEIKGSENTLVRGVGALIPAYVSEETTGNRKYYMRWGKQAYELSAIFVDFAPVKYTVGKLSGPASAVLEFAVGRNLAMDWEAPFSKMNHLERLYQGNDGRFWTSATWNLIQKSTLPFSVGGLVNAPVANEAGMLVALGPVSKGTNSNAVSDAMIAKFQSWAGQTEVRGKQFRVPFHEIVRQEIKDADANGYDGVALAKKALGRAAQQYYAQIYGNIQGNPSGKRDDEQIYRALVSLSRLNRGADDLSRSLKQRDQQRNIKPDQAMYQARRDTLAPMLRKVKGLPPVELRQAADGGDVSGILGTDEVPEAVLGYQVIKNLSPEDIAFFQQNPKAGGTFSEDPESPEGAGPMPAVTNSATKEPDSDAVGFLARDEVPETVLGYRIVPEAEFSASDYDYFRKYPKAAGFFDETTTPEAGEPTTPTQPEQPEQPIA